jgi:hypothetical protein
LIEIVAVDRGNRHVGHGAGALKSALSMIGFCCLQPNAFSQSPLQVDFDDVNPPRTGEQMNLVVIYARSEVFGMDGGTTRAAGCVAECAQQQDV